MAEIERKRGEKRKMQKEEDAGNEAADETHGVWVVAGGAHERAKEKKVSERGEKEARKKKRKERGQ